MTSFRTPLLYLSFRAPFGLAQWASAKALEPWCNVMQRQRGRCEWLVARGWLRFIPIRIFSSKIYKIYKDLQDKLLKVLLQCANLACLASLACLACPACSTKLTKHHSMLKEFLTLEQLNSAQESSLFSVLLRLSWRTDCTLQSGETNMVTWWWWVMAEELNHLVNPQNNY